MRSLGVKAATSARPPQDAAPSGPPPDAEDLLAARACVSLAGLGRPAPLGLLRDLCRVIGGQPADGLEPLAARPGLRKLTALGFPPKARAGLAALLIEPGGHAGWAPPGDARPLRCLEALEAALHGPLCDPESFAPRLTRLIAAADAIGDTLTALLRVAGPEAVAADPGLPPRLAHAAARVPQAAIPDRTVLAARLPWRGEGRALATSPLGARAGIARHGDPRDLLPVELAMPRDIFELRSYRNELAYRVKRAAEPPKTPPCVLVLDISPATFGDVEEVLRPAAHILAISLIERSIPAALLFGGGPARIVPLSSPEDLVELWTGRSLVPADADALFARAARAQSWIGQGDLAARTVLFSHTAFGAEARTPPPPRAVGVFAAAPGAMRHPALGDALAAHALVSAADSAQAIASRIAALLI